MCRFNVLYGPSGAEFGLAQGSLRPAYKRQVVTALCRMVIDLNWDHEIIVRVLLKTNDMPNTCLWHVLLAIINQCKDHPKSGFDLALTGHSPQTAIRIKLSTNVLGFINHDALQVIWRFQLWSETWFFLARVWSMYTVLCILTTLAVGSKLSASFSLARALQVSYLLSSRRTPICSETHLQVPSGLRLVWLFRWSLLDFWLPWPGGASYLAPQLAKNTPSHAKQVELQVISLLYHYSHVLRKCESSCFRLPGANKQAFCPTTILSHILSCLLD